MSQTQAEIYKDSSITVSDLANNSVTTEKVEDSAITRTKLTTSIRPTPFTTRGFNIPL
jgi:hypothetical protein